MLARTWCTAVVVGSLVLPVVGALGPTVAAARSADPVGTGSAETAQLDRAARGAATVRGRVRVVVATPGGIPATVLLTRGSRLRAVAKPPQGTRHVRTLRLPIGRYRVVPQPVTVAGVLFTGRVAKAAVRVSGAVTVRVRVRYRALPSASRLHAAAMTDTTIDLAWRGRPGASYVLRRSSGDVPPTTPSDGVGVAVTGTRAGDRGLQPGSRYAYALFTRVGGRLVGPLTVVAGTAAPAGSGAAAYVARPGTLLLGPSDIVEAAPTGSGVRLVLRTGVTPPAPGTAITLPASDPLPGGYLGVVEEVGLDGRTLALRPGGLSDAFDLFVVRVDDLSTPSTPLVPDPTRTTVESPRARGGTAGPRAGLPSCLGGGAAFQVTFSPSVSLGGHFSAALSTYRVDLGWFGSYSVLTGAALDAALTATVTGAMAVKAAAAVKCGIPFTAVMTPITTTPVPLSFYLTPVAEVTLSGAVEIANLGFTATSGVSFAGDISLSGTPSFTGSSSLSVSPLSPVLTTNAAVGLTLGGEAILGPGAGTSSAGVIAGVGGKLNPLDASFGPVFTAGDGRFDACLKAEAAFTRELNLTVKAWLGSVDISRSVTLDALRGSTQYPGSPWYLPTGCELLPPDPGGDLTGGGLDLYDDSTTGSDQAWGHLDGFALGTRAWVLSTGRVAEAVGPPSFTASTDFGRPGRDSLSAMVGIDTVDAAAFSATVVPQGDMLHVRYVFASEEYPLESPEVPYSDVMAIYVDGLNCAYVPGTYTPVWVNSINATTNPALFVDNLTGASGYGTSMDGLTVPLTCDVPVTPGTPVTIEVVVADGYDGFVDSAVALLDRGIWSD